MYNNTHYTTSKQFIQHQKALYFNDHQTATRIITDESPADCKAIGSDVKDFNQDQWDSIVKEICKPGIHEKFKQQPALMDVLVNCIWDKEIVECASDKVWGTGYTLSKPDCLNRRRWVGQGILGEILTEIRDEESHLRLHGTTSVQQPPVTQMSTTLTNADEPDLTSSSHTMDTT